MQAISCSGERFPGFDRGSQGEANGPARAAWPELSRGPGSASHSAGPDRVHEKRLPSLRPSLALDRVREEAGRAGTELTPALAEAAAERFDELEVEIEPGTKTYWSYMRPRERPSFTMGLLSDLARSQQSIKRLFSDAPETADQPLRFYVLASRLPGVFNLGGNLSLFAQRIRQRDRGSLTAYARACIEVLYTNSVSFDRPVVTIALVQGDALGGGFEAALSCDVIIAERGAKFGLPEILFNLFPGMGAYSFLSRKLGAARAEELILSGQTFGTEEMHAMGLVHVMAEPGQGKHAVRAYIERNTRRHSAHCGIYRAGRAVNPLAFEELIRVADLWVDAALRLGEADLRVMERLVARQDRRGSPYLLAAE